MEGEQPEEQKKWEDGGVAFLIFLFKLHIQPQIIGQSGIVFMSCYTL